MEDAATTDEALFAEQEDLAGLQTALRRAHNFALIFAVCNAPSYRNRLAQALIHHAQRPIVIVHLKPLEDNPTMDAQIAEALAAAPPNAAAFVFGLENLLPTNDPEKQFNTLRQLNWRRAGFGRLNCPVVFWIPDYALTLIANEAPDFHDWYSGIYTFIVPAAALPDSMQNTLAVTGDFSAISGLSFEEKKRWRETLEELIAEPRGDTTAEQHNLANLLNRLGFLAKETADYIAAKDYFMRAIKISEALLGSNHPQFASDVCNFGNILSEIGDLLGAKVAYERALQIYELICETENADVAVSVSNLGIVLHQLGDFVGSKAAFERALRIDEAIYGSEHPAVASDIDNIGNVLESMNDINGAKTAFERALYINEAAYGMNHPAVARSAANLGKVLAITGDLNAAKLFLERALNINSAAYGEEHPNVAKDVGNLGNILRRMGNLNGAKSADERAFIILNRTLGSQHPDTQQARLNLEALIAEIDAANKFPR